jgi:hypothetical protein
MKKNEEGKGALSVRLSSSRSFGVLELLLFLATQKGTNSGIKLSLLTTTIKPCKKHSTPRKAHFPQQTIYPCLLPISDSKMHFTKRALNPARKLRTTAPRRAPSLYRSLILTKRTLNPARKLRPKYRGYHLPYTHAVSCREGH